MSLRHPLARVKGFGASGEGSHHWWMQRLTALALIPLTLWALFSLLNHVGDDHQSVINWIENPGVAVLLVLYLGFMFLHASLGLQVVIEDYVHNESAKTVALLLVKGVFLLAATASIFAVLRIAL